MSKSTAKYIFIDTNTALHFKRPDQIDWLKLTGADEIVLVAAPILLRELEEQKVLNKSRKLRERADNYIKWLDKFVEAPETEVRPKVTWLFLMEEPQIDFGAERLSENIADDQLIASVLYYSRQSGAHPIVAVADIGLKIKLKSRHIDVLTLPEHLRLPVKQDPIERENEELWNKITRLESRMPTLSIAFEDGIEYHTLDIRDPKSINVESLKQIKEEHPYMTTSEEAGLSSSAGTKYAIELESRENRKSRYNQKLDEYFSNYQIYLDRYAAWYETICMHHMIKLEIANDGTALASNIDVELYFPEGVIPVNKDDIPEKPKLPVAPEKKQGLFIPYLRGNANFDVVGSAMERYKRLTPHLSSVPQIELDNNAIFISYSELKHGFCKISDPLIFRFISKDAVGSFKISYRLSANEIPDAVEDDLHIRIDNARQ